MATLKYKDESGNWHSIISGGSGGSGGYGLGSTAIMLTTEDDLNTIMKNGWYYWRTNNAPANVPTSDGTSDLTAMRCWTDDGTTFCQEIISLAQGCMMRRTASSSAANDWEWVNPPMVHNVEYRTTERFNGQPVYIKRYSVVLDFVGTAYNHAIGATASNVISLTGTVVSESFSGMFPYISDTGEVKAYAYVDGNGKLIVQSMQDLTDYTAEFVIKYIKP